MRCELTSPDLLKDIEPYQDDDLVQLVSLMDHTPGQRQWRNIEHLRDLCGRQRQDRGRIRGGRRRAPARGRGQCLAQLGGRGRDVPGARHPDRDP